MKQTKVAEKGLKVDLHIHSIYSSAKDGDKVKNNTLINLPLLIQGLLDNQVELCAITDHDTFNYEMYKTLKEEEHKENGIKKVLPGIEFSVEFLKDKVIHIVTIFDDKDDNKIKNIEKVMTEGMGKTQYKKGKGFFSRADYFEILNEIDLDFIMIAHQKKTVTSSQKPLSTDVMSLGKETFNQLVFMDYFDAYEFRNKKNDVYNKVFIAENELTDNLRFITGSDCHDWSVYPNVSKSEKTEFSFTYIKSLPSFRGLAMAVTDNRRISLANKFFNPAEYFVEKIELQIGEKEIAVPLSKGLNVIIGDNSIGKSLFLNAITDNYKISDGKLKRGYEKYLSKFGIAIKTIIPQDKIFMYNRQGEIRDIFDKEGMKPDEYLKKFYPDEINADKYRKTVEKELECMYRCLEKKFRYDRKVKELASFSILVDDGTERCITFINEKGKNSTKELQKTVNNIEIGIKDMNSILDSRILEETDRNSLENVIELLEIMLEKYKKKLGYELAENEKINIYTTYMNSYKREYNKKISDAQVLYADFVEKKNEAIQGIIEAVWNKLNLEKFEPNLIKESIVPHTNAVDKYRFVSKIGIEEIDNEYVNSLIRNVLRKDFVLDTSAVTEEELQGAIKRNSTEEISPIEVLKQKINVKLNEDFKVRNSIVEEGMDLNIDLSQGFDAQTYFTLISGEMRNKGVYIIDQPEDHISQKAIKEKVIGQFRRMGECRQVLMVTHNPQFIVNLDVDNVIFLTVENNKFCVKSGALEYEDSEYSILKIVADNIEGGLQTILGRMKRYEKNI